MSYLGTRIRSRTRWRRRAKRHLSRRWKGHSGILAFERELTALGGCARAIGEWGASARTIGRLDLGNIEYFSDVLSGDHKHADPEGVEGACITASCVDYSSAGACAGLEGTRGWQVVDAPRVLLHFDHLLVSLVVNVFGWITSNDGQSFAFYRTAMPTAEANCLFGSRSA